MEAKVFNIQGKETGRTVQLNDSVFGIEPNNHAIYLDVKQYMANKRQGTHKSKERSLFIHAATVVSGFGAANCRRKRKKKHSYPSPDPFLP